MVEATSTATLENLSRLASKPGVQSTLVLSKKDGSIIQSTGLLASAPVAEDGIGEQGLSNGAGAGSAVYDGEAKRQTHRRTAEDVAKMVFAFVDGARAFADGVKGGDEVKLLRMRTKKNEIVIVPDANFLLVVIHDTPPA